MAPETILQTKLFQPRTPQHFVPRPHLVGRINDALHNRDSGYVHKLTLISAPAGYGKTTLLSEWCRQSVFPCAWLSLDADDSNLPRFWSHVFAALRTAFSIEGQPILTELETTSPATVSAVLADWINHISQSVAPGVLILDDYHTIVEPSVHDSLAYWLEHCPTQLHLIITSRSDPPLPLSRLRGRGQLVELRTADLRFATHETVVFLNQAMGLNLQTGYITSLETRTEGWIVGLQMAAISMHRRNRDEISNFIDGFTGSHRFILDYLTDEVLLQQSGMVQNFLLHTCILDRLTSALCDAVTGQDGSQHILEQLETENLFIMPLDETRHWYRYHNLFASMLRQRLGYSQPDLLPALYLRASQWCEGNGFMADALRYAILSEDASRVAGLVARNVLVMMEFRELKTLERWLHNLPVEEFSSSPWIIIAHAWLLTSLGQLDGVEPLLQQAFTTFASMSNPSEEVRRGILGNLAAVRAYKSGLQGDYDKTIIYARECLENFPVSDTWMHTWSNVTLAFALMQHGQSEEADEVIRKALEISQDTGANHVRVLVLNNYAGFQLNKGKLHQAGDIFREVIKLDQEYTSRTGQHLPIAGYAYSELAGILCEWNDLDGAEQFIAEGIHICESWGEPQLVTNGNLRLAEIRAARADWSGALKAISIAQQAAQSLHLRHTARFAPFKALIHLHAGDLQSARRWATSLDVHTETSRDKSNGLLIDYVLARIDIADQRFDAALSRITHSVPKAQIIGDVHATIRAMSLQAMVLDDLGKIDQALDILEKALLMAEAGGFMRVFLNLGRPLEKILLQVVASGRSNEFIHRILDAFQREHQPRVTKTEAGIPLVEPLSEREQQVLRLLTTALTRAQIAEQLIISENTVRTHLKNIYQKLGVHTRAEAIARSSELKLGV